MSTVVTLIGVEVTDMLLVDIVIGVVVREDMP